MATSPKTPECKLVTPGTASAADASRLADLYLRRRFADLAGEGGPAGQSRHRVDCGDVQEAVVHPGPGYEDDAGGQPAAVGDGGVGALDLGLGGLVQLGLLGLGDQLLRDGAQRAQQRAQTTVDRVHAALGFIPA